MVRLLGTALFLGCNPQPTDGLDSVGDSTPDSIDTEISTPSRGNVLLIIADDLGLDAHPCYALGETFSPMKNVKKLCDSGVVFDKVWSNPVCSPTRASILTGRYPHQHQIGEVVRSGATNGLALGEWTLPMALDSHDEVQIAHANIGKWHLGGLNNGGATSPNLFGWDHYEGLIQGTLESYFSYNETVNGISQAVDEYATTETVNDAIRWIGEQEESWVLWLAFNAPHIPFHLPPSLLHSNPALVDDVDVIQENPRPYFRATLEALDIEIGRLLDNIDPEILAQTDIIFVGDNGTTEEVADSHYPMGRGKGTVYQGGIHVPLVVAGPSVVAGGRRSNTLVNVSDLFATVLDIQGVDWRENLPEGRVVDSQSLLPVLNAEASDGDGREWIMSEIFGTYKGLGQRALRINDHKLIQLPEEREEMYDLSVDPFETTNLLLGELSGETQEAYQRMVDISLSWPNPWRPEE
jgi:arylsulfatase A-like enzyme